MSGLWLNTFLGITGKYIIWLIDNYYIFIVPVVLVYGIFMTIASYNLKRLEKRVSTEIAKQAKELFKHRNAISSMEIIDRIKIDWEHIIKRYSFFPFISQESGLWVRKTNTYNIREIIMSNEQKILMTLERKGILKGQDRGKERENLYLEYFHRITRKE
ncbi:MAG: hypothetical protein FJW66_08325 [Actinobacteria bacterium]|nr:hypothetical protein [Actinomycetota bacterium]